MPDHFSLFKLWVDNKFGESLRVDCLVCCVNANLFFQRISLCITGFVGSSTSLKILVSYLFGLLVMGAAIACNKLSKLGDNRMIQGFDKEGVKAIALLSTVICNYTLLLSV